MTDQEKVTILKSEYEGLLRDRRELEELDYGGVDNWAGYEYVDWNYVDTGERNQDD